MIHLLLLHILFNLPSGFSFFLFSRPFTYENLKALLKLRLVTDYNLLNYQSTVILRAVQWTLYL